MNIVISFRAPQNILLEPHKVNMFMIRSSHVCLPRIFLILYPECSVLKIEYIARYLKGFAFNFKPKQL